MPSESSQAKNSLFPVTLTNWNSLLTFELRFLVLVQDPEPGIHRLVDFVDLPGDGGGQGLVDRALSYARERDGDEG